VKIDVVALRSGGFNANFMGVCQFSNVVKKKKDAVGGCLLLKIIANVETKKGGDRNTSYLN